MLSASISLALTVLILIAVPGPSNLYIIGQTLASGPRAAMLSIVGNAGGVATVGLAIILFLGTLLQHSPWLHTTLVIIGAATLVGLSGMYLLDAWREWSGKAAESTVTALDTTRQALVSGWIVGVTNPKGLILFGTIVPGFLPPDSDIVPNLIWLALVPLVIGPLVDTVWVLCASAARHWILHSSRGLAVIKALGGLMLLVMAILMLAVEV